MNKFQIRIGETVETHEPVILDLHKLVETRALVEASSGGGKSTLMRLIAERSAGLVQTIILDHEDEFPTLRTVLDVLLVGDGRDVPISVSSAPLLARRLAEMRISAVINLFDLPINDRRHYVGAFLTELLSLKKDLWHPMLIMLDEAHIYAPEKGDSPSRAPVVNMMSQGRKREFCEIVATQRFSKIDKDAIADAKNVFIGGTFLDVDQKRAGDMLGIKSAEYPLLRDMAVGEWFAFGQALVSTQRGILRFHADKPVTQKPKSGTQHFVVPKASDVISSLVEQLGDIPAQAAAEAQVLEALQIENARLKREMAARPVQVKMQEPRVEVQVVEKPVLNGQLPRLEAVLDRITTDFVAPLTTGLSGLLAPLTVELRSIHDAIERVQNAPPVTNTLHSPKHAEFIRAPNPRTVYRVTPKPQAPPRAPQLTSEPTNLPEIGAGEKKILRATAQYPEGVSREQLTILTGYKRSSRDTYIQRLAQRGFVVAQGPTIVATEEGIQALGPNFEPLPTGAELQAYWLARLSGGEKAILQVAIDHHPNYVERTIVDESTGYKRSSRDTYIQRLLARRLVTAERGAIRASDELFDQF